MHIGRLNVMLTQILTGDKQIAYSDVNNSQCRQRVRPRELIYTYVVLYALTALCRWHPEAENLNFSVITNSKK